MLIGASIVSFVILKRISDFPTSDQEFTLMASEKPWRRNKSVTDKPDSASRRKPMICSSVNLFLTSNPLLRGIELQSQPLLKSGGTSDLK
jgi:hypothetical protein